MILTKTKDSFPNNNNPKFYMILILKKVTGIFDVENSLRCQSSSALRLIPGRDTGSNYSDKLCVEIYCFFVEKERKSQSFKGTSCNGDIDAVKGLDKTC